MTQYFKLDTDGRIMSACEVADVADLEHIPEITVENPNPITSWPIGPSPSSVWYWTNGATVWVETKTVDELKAAKNAEINAARLSANRTTFPFSGKLIACDELSRSDIDAVSGTVSLTGAMPANWAGYWKCTDNTYVAVPDVTAWKSFYAAMVDQGSSNFSHAQNLKSQLAAATKAADIEAIRWN